MFHSRPRCIQRRQQCPMQSGRRSSVDSCRALRADPPHGCPAPTHRSVTRAIDRTSYSANRSCKFFCKILSETLCFGRNDRSLAFTRPCVSVEARLRTSFTPSATYLHRSRRRPLDRRTVQKGILEKSHCAGSSPPPSRLRDRRPQLRLEG